MTRKDYELFAKRLKDAKEHELRFLTDEQFKEVVNLIAKTFASDNYRFDWDRFVKACGIE